MWRPIQSSTVRRRSPLALHEAQEDKDRTDVVLVIGKGHERWIKDLNRHVPYEGDDCVVERLLQ